MDKVGGYAGWRWIFIIEGCITVVCVIIGLLCIPGYPEDSTFLKPEEKRYLLAMLKKDAGPSRPNHYSYLVMKECLFDPKIWLGTLAYFGADNAASSIVSFQPTILKSLGYSNAEAQVHTIPVFIVALCSLLICAYLSGKVGHRYGFLMFGSGIGIIGWSIELAQVKAVSARYFGMFAITASAYIQMPILVVWLANNMGGNAKAAFATGVMIGLGNCGNLVSSNVFITSQNPRYRTGFGTGLGLNLLGVVASTTLELYCWVSNRRRDSGKANVKLNNGSEVLEELGDDHPDFRYIL
ncbi:major facilitator superfamily domain-containing protein [Xylogone sp. PMI_703]|nr:major facilitator superfamily domain-containing protein [Xylogone sp. PMI_703]